MVPDHGCTTYCKDTEHCDLVYSGDDSRESLLRYSIARHYEDTYGVQVVRIREATEAPDLVVFPPESLRQVAGNGPDDKRRWLVWWVEEPRPLSGSDISAKRAALGLSQSQFAEKIGVSVRTLQNWEQGHRTARLPGMVRKMIDAL